MEMTLRRLGIDNIKELLNGFTLPVGILVLIAMMVLPLPVYLLDTFFVTNILLSLLLRLLRHRHLNLHQSPSACQASHQG